MAEHETPTTPKGLATEWFPFVRLDTPYLARSMNFVVDPFATGRRIKFQNCDHEVTYEWLKITFALQILSVNVTLILHSIAQFRGYPMENRTVQVEEFMCRALEQWAFKYCTKGISRFGIPSQNVFIERFNGRFKDKCPNEHSFSDISHIMRLMMVCRIITSTINNHHGATSLQQNL